MPASYHMRAWFRDNTLQSKIAFVVEALRRATDRPTLTAWSRDKVRSLNGCEFGRQCNIALGIPEADPLSCCGEVEEAFDELLEAEEAVMTAADVGATP